MVEAQETAPPAAVKPARKPQGKNPTLPSGKPRGRRKEALQRKQRSDKWDPDPEQLARLEAMAGVGLNLSQMAHILGLHVQSMIRRMREKPEIRAAVERGRALATMNVSQAAYKMAVSEKVPDMTKFWLKARAGWRDTQAIEIGRGRDYENYSDQDLEAEICEQERLLGLMEPVPGETELLAARVRIINSK